MFLLTHEQTTVVFRIDDSFRWYLATTTPSRTKFLAN